MTTPLTEKPEGLSATPTMTAAVYERYGDPQEVLELRQIPRPVPRPDEVLVRVRASSVNALDWHLITGTPYVFCAQFGLRRPKRAIPGADLAGVVESVGGQVTRFAPGDEVFAEVAGGGLAEYVSVAEGNLVAKPANVTFEEAGGIGVAGLTALQGLRDWGGMKPGDRVLINGASGGVGTLAIQVAKALGGEVTAVCSTNNVDTAWSLGADAVIDYDKEDFVARGGGFDIFFDGVGNRSLAECIEVLQPEGIYLAISGPKPPWFGPLPRLLGALVVFRLRGRRLAAFRTAEQDTTDLETLGEMMESGSVRTVIDRIHSLAEASAALAYLGEGHARGKVIVTVGS